jgi:hypothetical protein
VGGTSSRQQVSDDYAASGGGFGGLGKGVSIHQAMSENAIEIRDKYRLKMATSVLLVLPVWGGSVEGWYSFSKKFVLHMKKVGYEIVCRPGFVTTAKALKWTPEEIVEAKGFVWDQLLAAVQASESASNALSMAGAEHDGGTCFHQLELNNKVPGHALEIKYRGDLLNFAPTSREDPISMITRFDVLLNKYLDLENSEVWNPERKIRTVLELFRLWEDLKVTVDTMRFAMTDPAAMLVDNIPNDELNNPHLFSYGKICRRAKAVWKSYASSDKDVRLKINRAVTQESSDAGALTPANKDADLSSQFSDLIASIKVLTTKVESKHSPGKGGGKGNGKPSGSGSKREQLVKQNQNCLNPRCKLPFEGYTYQHVCNECFQAAKSDRQSVPLQGSRDGTDYSGKNFVVVDSAEKRYAKRGGWKIEIKKFRLGRALTIDEEAGSRLNLTFSGAYASSTSLYPPSISILSQRVTTEFDYGLKFFFGAGSCGGVEATGISALFHDAVTPLRWVIEVMKSGDDALVPVTGSGVAVLLGQDKDSKEDLILLYGGMLQCPASQVTSTVGSSSQVGNFFNSSSGQKGAQFHTANPKKAYMQLPDGHSIALHVNDDGAFGCSLSAIRPDDPRMLTCKKIWMSEDCVYKPPGSSPVTPIQINQETVRLRMDDDFGCDTCRFPASASSVPTVGSVGSLIDTDTTQAPLPAVSEVLSEPALGHYTYIDPLADHNDDLEVLGGIFVGRGGQPIFATLPHGFGGKEVMTPKGLAVLKAHNTKFLRPASHFKRHKAYRNGVLDKTQTRPKVPMGQSVATDTLSLNIPGLWFRYFQLFGDKSGPMMMCYAMKDKTGESYLATLQQHCATFTKPPRLQEIRSDNAPELTEGVAKRWMLSQCLKIHKGVPNRPLANILELKAVRDFSSATTHIMLDSQLPLRFLELVGQAACIVISFMHFEIDGRHSSGFFEIFHKDPDLRMLKRVGCEIYFLLEKQDRLKYGPKGVRGVLVGCANHSHPDWTYVAWSPVTDHTYYRRDILFNQRPMPFRDARKLISTPASGPQQVRRGIAPFSRSVFRDFDEDMSLDNWDSPDNPESPLCDLGAAAWLPVNDSVASPIQVGDTLFVSDHPTAVISVSPQEIRARNLITNVTHSISPRGQFFRDTEGMLAGGRASTRRRAGTAFYTYNTLGGEIDLPKFEVKRAADGSDLVGSTFWNAENEKNPNELPTSRTPQWELHPSVVKTRMERKSVHVSSVSNVGDHRKSIRRMHKSGSLELVKHGNGWNSLPLYHHNCTPRIT